MYSIRAVTNLLAIDKASTGSLGIYDQSGNVFEIPANDPALPLLVVNATTRTMTFNGTFVNPGGGPAPAPTSISLISGTAATPPLSFISSANTGLYLSGSLMTATAAGTPIMNFGSDNINILTGGGTSATSLRWLSDPGLGLYATATSIRVAVAGSEQLVIDSVQGITVSMGENRPTTSTSATFTVTPDQYFINLTGGVPQVITLPLASTMPGRNIIMYRRGAGLATIVPTAPDTIDGTLFTISLTSQYDRILFVSDGLDSWITI
jgi:hypothetical protein